MATLKKLLLVLVFLLWAGIAVATPVEQAVIDELVALYGLDTAEYVIEVETNRLKTAEVAAGELTLRPLTQKEPLGLFTVAATVTQAGTDVESAQLRLRISRFADVLVAADKFDMREALVAEKIEVRRVDVTNMAEKPLRAFEEIAGRRASRQIRKGTVLTSGCVEIPPDVESGRTVTIVYLDGLCRVTTAGTVLQTAMAGDYVKVRNNGSGKIIMARVMDENAVVVEP